MSIPEFYALFSDIRTSLQIDETKIVKAEKKLFTSIYHFRVAATI